MNYGSEVRGQIIKFLEANIGEKSLKAWVKQDFLGQKKHKTKAWSIELHQN